MNAMPKATASPALEMLPALIAVNVKSVITDLLISLNRRPASPVTNVEADWLSKFRGMLKLITILYLHTKI